MAGSQQCAGTIKRRNPPWDQPQCTREGTVEREGKPYCRYHDPAMKGRRSKAASRAARRGEARCDTPVYDTSTGKLRQCLKRALYFRSEGKFCGLHDPSRWCWKEDK